MLSLLGVILRVPEFASLQIRLVDLLNFKLVLVFRDDALPDQEQEQGLDLEHVCEGDIFKGNFLAVAHVS